MISSCLQRVDGLFVQTLALRTKVFLWGLPLLILLCSQTGLIAQNGVAEKEGFVKALDEAIDPYFYNSFDSTIVTLDKFDSVASAGERWSEVLFVKLNKVWAATAHSEIDSLFTYLQAGDSIYRKYQKEIDHVDPEKLDYTELNSSRGWYEYAVGNYQGAIDIYRNSAFTKDDQLIVLDSVGTANNLHNLGVLNIHMGDYENGIRYLQWSIKLLPKNPNRYSKERDYNYKQAVAIAQIAKGSFYKGLAQTGRREQDFLEALGYFQESVKWLEGKENEKAAANLYLTIFENLSWLYREKRDYKSAVYYAKKALDKIDEGDFERQVNLYCSVAKAYAGEGNYNIVLDNLGKAMELAQKKFKGKNPLKAKVYYHQGEVYANQGKWEQGIRYYQKAISQLVDGFEGHDDIYTNPLLDKPVIEVELLKVLLLKGDALAEWGESTREWQKSESALSTYSLCIALVGKMRNNYQNSDSRQFLAAQSLPLYEKALGLAYKGFSSGNGEHLSVAFEIMEKNKGGMLLDGILESQAKKFAGVPDHVVSEEARLKGKVSYLQRTIFESGGDGKEGLEKAYFQASESYQNFIKRLERAYPKYYDLKYASRPVLVEHVRKGLVGPNELFIEYFIGDESLYAMAVAQNRAVFKKLNLTDSLYLMMGEYTEGIKQYDFTKPVLGFQKFVNASHYLYKVLLHPILNEFGTSFDQLVIVPDGPLGYIPFDALIDEIPKQHGNDYSKLPYLIKQYKIRQAPSAKIDLKKRLMPGKSPQHAYIGFAPSYSKGVGTAADNVPYRQFNGKLNPLKYNQEEVGYALNYFDGLDFSGDKATEVAFKEVGGEGKLIHLSMHAFVDDDNPLYSSLVFEKPDVVTSEEDDGVLHLYELYGLKLTADLAVLSACNTGVGRLARGEGIISLGRSFQYAGCPSVLMSLWQVNDKTTAIIMKGFFANLHDGMKKSEALQTAKLTFLKKPENKIFAHPYFWSSYVLVGDDKEVVRPLFGRYLKVSILGFVSALILFVFIYNRNKKKT